MPSNAEEYVKSWSTHLKADGDAVKHCPIYPEVDTMLRSNYPPPSSHPLDQVFKLPVPWRKKDDVTQHIMKVDDTICLERGQQNLIKGCPYTCQCRKVIEDDEDSEPSFPIRKLDHCPKAEIKDLCSCKQLVIKEHEPCPPEQLSNPVLVNPVDLTACTCPRVPLPFIKPEPRLQQPVQCECVERSKRQAPTFFKCMQERRQVNIAQLFSQKEQPKPVHSFTVAATQVELDPIKGELKETFPIIPSTTVLSEKSQKSKSSKKSSVLSASTKKTKRTRSEFTVSTAVTAPTSYKESSSKDICPCCKKETMRLTSVASNSTTSVDNERPARIPFKKPLKKTSVPKLSDQEIVKVNKSCSTINRTFTRKPMTSKVKGMQSSSEWSSKLGKSKARTGLSNSSWTSRNSSSTKSSSMNTYPTYFMEGNSGSSSSGDAKHRGKPKYVDVDDIGKIKAKGGGSGTDPFCDIKFDNEEHMKQIKEIIERESQDCKTRLKLAYVDGMYPGFHAGHKTCCPPYMYVPKNMSWLYNTCEGAGKIKPDLGWRPGSIRPDVASIMAITKKGKPQPEFSHPTGRGIQRVDEVGQKKDDKSKGDKEEKSEELDTEEYACLAEIDVYKKRAVDENEELVTIIEDEPVEKDPPDMKPTLHMHKTHGQYFVTMHPARKGKQELKPGMQDSVMLTFDPKALDTDAPSDSEQEDATTTTVSTDSMEMDFTSAFGMYQRRDPKQLVTVQTSTHKTK